MDILTSNKSVKCQFDLMLFLNVINCQGAGDL